MPIESYIRFLKKKLIIKNVKYLAHVDILSSKPWDSMSLSLSSSKILNSLSLRFSSSDSEKMVPESWIA